VAKEARLTRAVEEYLADLEAGGRPDRDAFLARYPDIAAPLAECLDGLDFVHAAAAMQPAAPVCDGPAPAPDSPGSIDRGETLGDFRIVREVGRGGMGIVYEAEQVSLGRRVALKVLPFAATMDPRHLQRFHNEARAAAGLHHSNIVPVFAVGCERGVHFYAMQFIDGRTLADLIAGQRPGQPAVTPTVDEAEASLASTVPQAAQATSAAPRDRAHFRRAAEWGIQAAEALDCAHQLGVVHRDVKPANLLVDGGGRLWVTDFGLAQVQSDARLTRTGDLVGTLRYMSPEQALAKRVVIDHRTDVYSLGATLYELLMLEPVFAGADRQELLRQIAFEEPRRPRRVNRAVPLELETIALKALEKNPADRYATAQEMADDLERWLRHEPIRARRPTLVQRGAKWGRRHRPAVAAGVTVLLMALALGGYLGWVHHGRAMQREATERAALIALDESDAWQAKRRLPDALSAARRAAGLLPGGDADDALRQRVRGRLADLELLDKLENVRLEMTAVKDGDFDRGSGVTLYEKTFREAGLDVEALPREEVADRIGASTVAAEVAGVLDDWASLRRKVKGEDDSGWKDLLWIARAAEPDAWRNGVRDALERRDQNSLAALAASDKVFRLMPPTLFVLGDALCHDKRVIVQAEVMLREAQRRQPDDFWLNLILFRFFRELQPSPEDSVRFASAAVAIRPGSPGARVNLGGALAAKGQLDEAIAEYREAIRLTKDNPEAHYNLGNALRTKGQLDEAIAEYREAIRLKKDYARAHNNLGNALYDKGRLDEAIAELREAIRLNKDFPEAHYNLGIALREKGRLDEAVAEYREAIRLKKDNAEAHNNLGIALATKGRLDEAIAEYRQAIRIKKDFAEAHCTLGLAIIQKGQSPEAVEAFRRGNELGSRNPHWPHHAKAQAQLRLAEQLARLDERLSATLQGEEQPKDAAERLGFAQLCHQFRKLYATAARFYDEAFAEEPQLADDLGQQHRYKAACAAALAGCGQGEDAKSLDDKERARLRQQAAEWLRADLKAYRQLMDRSAGKAGPAIAQRLQHWLQDTDFAGVRGPEALGKLPEAERRAWQDLWADVAQTLARAQGGPAPKEKAVPK
jgi:tetratricopeptide (TPR) repeat protein